MFYFIFRYPGDDRLYVIAGEQNSLIMLSQFPFLRFCEKLNEKITCYCLWGV